MAKIVLSEPEGSVAFLQCVRHAVETGSMFGPEGSNTLQRKLEHLGRYGDDGQDYKLSENRDEGGRITHIGRQYECRMHPAVRGYEGRELSLTMVCRERGIGGNWAGWGEWQTMWVGGLVWHESDSTWGIHT